MSDPDLQLHLALDELQGPKLYDGSPARRNALHHGVRIVDDEGFGPCLELAGTADSYVELPDLSGVLGSARTIMSWVKLPVVDRQGLLLDLETSIGNRFSLSLQRTASGELLFSTVQSSGTQGSMLDYRFTDPRMNQLTSTWFHLALSFTNATQAAYYLNGRPISDYQMTAQGTLTPLVSGAEPPAPVAGPPSTLGKSFPGRLAQFRVYSRALTAEEVNWNREGDRPVQYRYRITHPIDFSLENRDADPTLFMDGHPEGQPMFLRVDNVTSGEVHLAPLADPTPSESNCHFELAFRPGTLEPGSIAKIALAAPNSPWKIAGKSWTGPDDRDSLYLLSTQPGPIPGGGLTLELGHVLPDSRYGTRTTLVDLRYRNLKSGAGETITGSAQQNLDLVNHQGRRNIPLHVGFAGSNTVLNNASTGTTLRLRVTNVLYANDLYNNPLKSGFLRFNDKSRFFLSLDEREGTDWALNKVDQLKEIVVRYAKGPVTPSSPTVRPSGGTEGKPLQWEIPLQTLSLGPEEYLELQLENVRAAGSDGHSNLYLDYRDIPGYWNGRFTAVIEKTPLVYRGGKVGIGLTPEVELDVKGTLRVDSLIVKTWTPTQPRPIALAAGWNGFVTPTYFRDAHGMVHLSGVCNFILPDGPEKRGVLERCKSTSIFTLPNDFAPDQTLYHHARFEFPARVRCSSDRHPASTTWHILQLGWGGPNGPYHAMINVSLPPELVDMTQYIFVYLDGISYLAKQ